MKRGGCEQGGGRVDRAGSERDSVYIWVAGANTADLGRDGANWVLRSW